jgi:hypothetical protein
VLNENLGVRVASVLSHPYIANECKLPTAEKEKIVVKK